MAIFRDEPDRWQDLDFRLLRTGAVTLYYDRRVLDEDVAWLAARGYQLDVLDGSCWLTEGAAHASLASVLQFPDYYGCNLNAFNDCLRDLDIPFAGGRVLVLDHYDVPAVAIRPFAAALLDMIATTARHELLFGRRLLALVRSDDPRLAFEPVGACPVSWNPREWLNRSRDI
jgi:hypothetical protein